MDTEYQSLGVENKTWTLVNLPPNKSLISTKWIFCRKFNADGSIARFVARGFSQDIGINYFDTFSPVIKMTLLHILLILATIHDYHIHQMNVVTTFLNKVLQEEIYIQRPDGYIQPGQEHRVYRLLKSLDGFKQALRVWYDLFHGFFY